MPGRDDADSQSPHSSYIREMVIPLVAYRIALVTTTFPFPRAGVYPGIEKLSLELSSMLDQAGFGVDIFTTMWNGGQRHDRFKGLSVTRLPDSSVYFGRAGALLDMHYMTWGRFVGDAILGAENYDLVHAVSPLSSAASFRKAGVPLVSHFHHYEFMNSATDLLFKPVHHVLERRAYTQSRLVITPSQQSLEDVHTRLGVSLDRIRLIPYAIDTRSYHAKGFLLDRETLHLLFVGIHEERKGLRYLLEALALLRRRGIAVTLTTVGDGPQLEALRILARRLKVDDSVEFRGRVDDPSGTIMPEVFADADCFVFPSLQEGFGFVLVEAMASGLPIVATNTRAVAEVLGNVGMLVPGRDSEALATTIGKLAGSVELRLSLGQAGRQRAIEMFDRRQVVGKLLAVYREAVGEVAP